MADMCDTTVVAHVMARKQRGDREKSQGPSALLVHTPSEPRLPTELYFLKVLCLSLLPSRLVRPGPLWTTQYLKYSSTNLASGPQFAATGSFP